MWKPIAGHEGSYEVSDEGQVRSLDRTAHGRRFRGKIIKPQTHPTIGYCSVMLCKDGVPKRHQVHRLVAEAFIPNPDSLPQVNHLDLNKTNNCVSNLEWCTRQENINHASVAFHRGEMCHNAKLNPDSVRLMRVRHARGDSVASLAREYGVTYSVAHKAVHRQSWRHL